MSKNRFGRYIIYKDLNQNTFKGSYFQQTTNNNKWNSTGIQSRPYSRYVHDTQKSQKSQRLLQRREQDEKVKINHNSMTYQKHTDQNQRFQVPNGKDTRRNEKNESTIFPEFTKLTPNKAQSHLTNVLTSPRQTSRTSERQMHSYTIQPYVVAKDLQKDNQYIGSSSLVPVESPKISERAYLSNRRYDDNIPKGLPNIGNTCYANSLLQVLCQTPNLYHHLNHLCQIESLQVSVRHKTVTRALLKLVEEMITVSKKPTMSTISNLMNSVSVRERSFEVGYQNDCHSFLLQILSGIEDENGKDACSMFEIQMIDQMYFSSCGHTEITDTQLLRGITVPSNSQDVFEGINSLLDEEEFDEVDVPCRACHPPTKVGSKTIKRLRFESLPQILFLQLGCFQETQHGGRLQISKSRDRIKYPTTLQLEVNNNNVIYHLYGVVNHFGSTYGGHYTAFVKNLTSSTNVRWYECNDSSVLETNEQLVLNSRNAYILFYMEESQNRV